MFTAKAFAILSIVLLIIAIFHHAWIQVSVISAVLVEAMYMALAIERKVIKSPPLFSQLAVMGVAMAGCSIASKKASHAWLKYLAKKPKGIKDDFA